MDDPLDFLTALIEQAADGEPIAAAELAKTVREAVRELRDEHDARVERLKAKARRLNDVAYNRGLDDSLNLVDLELQRAIDRMNEIPQLGWAEHVRLGTLAGLKAAKEKFAEPNKGVRAQLRRALREGP